MITAMNQAESTKNFASYTITEGLVVSISSVMHIVGYMYRGIKAYKASLLKLVWRICGYKLQTKEGS